MKWKAFFIIFEGLSLKQINNFFLEGESPTLNNPETIENIVHMIIVTAHDHSDWT